MANPIPIFAPVRLKIAVLIPTTSPSMLINGPPEFPGPTKVVRVALQNAASVAGLLITTEAMIAEKPEKKKEMPPMPPGEEF